MLIEMAVQLARTAHQGQVRKYAKEPYIVHPESVARIVSTVPHDVEMIAAAWLHDVVEDTSVTIEMIEAGFGHDVAGLVADLTSKRIGTNRAARKQTDKQRLSAASSRAKTIKLADILDNLPSIIEHDKGFARIYVAEKRDLLEALTDGDMSLYTAANNLIEGFVCD